MKIIVDKIDEDPRHAISKADVRLILSELREIHASLNEADQIAQVMSVNIRKTLGMSEDQIQALLAAELHRITNE